MADKLAKALGAFKAGAVSAGYVTQLLDAERAVMRQALAALEAVQAKDGSIEQPQVGEAIAALRSALEGVEG